MESDWQMKNIAIITARGGSKRIPGKNIKFFCGKPLIAYSIDAAISSGLFDRVIVSTDSPDISQVAIQYGAETPFIRSKANSDDFSTTDDVLVEVINQLLLQGENYDSFCCIYPTAPMITPQKLITSFNLLKNSAAYSVIPVTKFNYPIQRALIVKNNELQMREAIYLRARSQDLEIMYHDTGQFYWCFTKAFLKEKSLFTSKCCPFIIQESEVQDIDTIEDFEIAELKYTLMIKKMKEE